MRVQAPSAPGFKRFRGFKGWWWGAFYLLIDRKRPLMKKPLQPPCGRGNAFPLWWLAPPPFPRKRGHYKAPLCCERLMKGLLCVSLLSHRSAGGRWCCKAPNPHALRRHYERKRAFDTMKTGGGQSVPLLGLELAHQTVSASSFEPHFVNGLCR